MIRNLIVGVISFIITLVFLVFIRRYTGYDLLDINLDNAIYTAMSIFITTFLYFVFYILIFRSIEQLIKGL